MPQYGVSNDDGISQYLKCYITDESTGIMVVGYIGDGASKSLSSNWTSPFESDTAGKAAGMDKVADLIQAGTGNTLVTQFNSRMVWEGTTPPTLSLPLYFHAKHNARNEVDRAIMYLEQFASPQLSGSNLSNASLPTSLSGAKQMAKDAIGRTPQPVTVNVGRRFVMTNVLILEVQSELDAPRTKDGYMTRNTVNLSITPAQMINRSEIPKLYQ